MLDKKALRRFAAERTAPAIPSNHGLLHAQQVNYIVRTDVRIIGHSRTLVLYVYDRTKTADGNPAPVWTMFHTGADYVTLAHKNDGSTCWREAAFERLDRDYYFTKKCAFYSARDEQRVCNYFHDADHGGIDALVRTQKAILDKRSQKRQHRQELTVKSIGKAGRYYDRDTVQAVEKISDNEVVVRLVKVYYDYGRDCLMPKTDVYENARIFIRPGPDGSGAARWTRPRTAPTGCWA